MKREGDGWEEGVFMGIEDWALCYGDGERGVIVFETGCFFRVLCFENSICCCATLSLFQVIWLSAVWVIECLDNEHEVREGLA